MRLLDPRFPYRNSANTDVRDTFKRHGFKPTTDEDRKRAQEKLHGKSGDVVQIETKRRPR